LGKFFPFFGESRKFFGKNLEFYEINCYLQTFFLTDGFYLKIKTQTHHANNLYTKDTKKEVEFSEFVLGRVGKNKIFLSWTFSLLGVQILER
jgi:hypothetical protein